MMTCHRPGDRTCPTCGLGYFPAPTWLGTEPDQVTAYWHANDRKTNKADYQHSPAAPEPGSTMTEIIRAQSFNDGLKHYGRANTCRLKVV